MRRGWRLGVFALRTHRLGLPQPGGQGNVEQHKDAHRQQRGGTTVQTCRHSQVLRSCQRSTFQRSTFDLFSITKPQRCPLDSGTSESRLLVGVHVAPGRFVWMAFVSNVTRGKVNVRVSAGGGGVSDRVRRQPLLPHYRIHLYPNKHVFPCAYSGKTLTEKGKKNQRSRWLQT